MKPKMFDAVSALVEGQISGSTTFESFIYHENQTPPTEEAVQAKLKELEKQYADNEYQRKRLQEYPSIQELVVALYDADDKAEIDKKRAEIKKKYPKPE